MKLAHLGLMAIVLAGGFYGFHRYQRRDSDSGRAALGPSRVDPGSQTLSVPIEESRPTSDPAASEGNVEGDDGAAYRDIDRLMAEKSPRALDALLKYLDHPNNWVKAHALKALRSVGSPRALPRLVALLESKGHELAIRGAYMAIGGIGPNMTSSEERQMAVDGLKKSLDLYRDGTDAESRGNMYALIEAAGKIPGPESGEFLLAELPKFHEHPHIQYSIIKALGEIKYKPAEPVLRQYRADLIKEGPEPWRDKERYSDLLKAVDQSLFRIAGQGAE